MKMNIVYAALLAAAIATPGAAQVSVYVGSAPPAFRHEERGPMPGQGYVWVEGYWAPDGRHYRWVPGRWDRPPYEGAYWNHPHYDHYQEGWQLHEGHWDRENHEGDRGRDREHHDDDRGRDHEHHDDDHNH